MSQQIARAADRQNYYRAKFAPLSTCCASWSERAVCTCGAQAGRLRIMPSIENGKAIYVHLIATNLPCFPWLGTETIAIITQESERS